MKISVSKRSVVLIAIVAMTTVGCKSKHDEQKKMVEEANKKQAEIQNMLEEANKEKPQQKTEQAN